MPPEEDEKEDKPARADASAGTTTGAESKAVSTREKPRPKEGGGSTGVLHLQAAGASASAAVAVSSDLSTKARAGVASTRQEGDSPNESDGEGTAQDDSDNRPSDAAAGRPGVFKVFVALYLKLSAILKKLVGLARKAGKTLRFIPEGLNVAYGHFKRFASPILALIKRVLGCFSFIGKAMETFTELAEDLRLSQHVKIIVSFVQVLGSFVSFQVEWPPALTQFMSDIGGLVQFNIVELPKLSCLWAGVDFWSTLLVTTLGPVAVFILLFIPVGICKLKGMCFGWTNATSEQYAALQDQFFNNFLFGAFLIYPIASLSSLQAFNCHETLDVVRSDMRMPCPDILSLTGLYSVVCFFVYPIGMPVGFYFVMKINKVPELARSKKVNRAFTNLLTMYNKTLGTLECRKVAQLVGRVDADDAELERRIERFYRRVALLEHDDKDAADAVETDIHLHRCLRAHFQLADEEMLDKTAVINLTHHIVERSNRFVGMETMGSLSSVQITLLLEHDWPTSGAAGKGRAALKKDMIKTLFKKFGAPREEPPWKSPFGKYYPDPKDEANCEFYYGKSDEQMQEEEEGKKKAEAEAEAQLAEDTKLAEEKELKRQKSMLHGFLKKASSIRRAVGFFKSSGEMPEKDKETLKREADKKRADMIFQLEELVLKMLRLQVIACPVLVWDPNSSGEEEKLAIKRSGMIFSMFQVECWYWELCEMLRKFMMVTVLVFIFPGEPAQIGIGLLIVFAFLVLHLLLKPFATPDLNNMQTVSQVSLLLTLFVGLMLVVDKYMQKELDLAASGAWGLVDLGQASLLQLNRLMFSYMGTGVNIFTMMAPPLLMARKFYLGLGTRQQMIEKARNQLRELRESVQSIVDSVRGLMGLKKKEPPVADTGKLEKTATTSGAIAAAVVTNKISKGGHETAKLKVMPEENARAAPSLEIDPSHVQITAQGQSEEALDAEEAVQASASGSVTGRVPDARDGMPSGSAFLSDDLIREAMLAGTSSVNTNDGFNLHGSFALSPSRLLHRINSSTEFQIEADFAATAYRSDTSTHLDGLQHQSANLDGQSDVDWWALERDHSEDAEVETSSSTHKAPDVVQTAEDIQIVQESDTLTRALLKMGSAKILTTDSHDGTSKLSVEKGSITRSTSILPDPEDAHELKPHKGSDEQGSEALQGPVPVLAAPRSMLRHPSVRKLEQRHVVSHLRPAFGNVSPPSTQQHTGSIGQSDYDVLMELSRDEMPLDPSAGESERLHATAVRTGPDRENEEQDGRTVEEATDLSSAPAGPASNGT